MFSSPENAQETVNPTFLLAWIPESLLNEKGSSEWNKFVKVEEKLALQDEDDGAHQLFDSPGLAVIAYV
jgi:hypothetical protein